MTRDEIIRLAREAGMFGGWSLNETLRDYFASSAMQGYLTHEQAANHFSVDAVARWSYEMADAMLRARNQA